jgi:hypothetical protein
MYRFVLAATLLLAGCQNIVGPFQKRPPERVDDPFYTISEQQRRERARLALPDEQNSLTPGRFVGPGDAVGR